MLIAAKSGEPYRHMSYTEMVPQKITKQCMSHMFSCTHCQVQYYYYFLC